MQAWFAGEFESCLELCDAIRSRGIESRTHVALLRARALLRLDRPDDALLALQTAAAFPAGTDEAITATMLSGVAHVRRGDPDHGLALLLAAQTGSARAHPTIRSEIALNIGLAQYGRRDFDAAEQALNLVSPDSDLVHARAIQYRAWIAQARSNSEQSARLFRAALAALDTCRHYDRFFEANCVRALAHLSLERLDRKAWAEVAERRAKIDWSANGLAQPRFFIAYCAAAYQLDVEGNPLEAAREARHAEQIAPSDAYRVQALCKRASIYRRAGEPLAQRDHLEAAIELLRTCGTALAGDEAMVPYILAEELATIDHPETMPTLMRHKDRATMSPVLSAKQSLPADPYRSLVEARVLESLGDTRAALQRFRQAHAALSRCGYTRRAVFAALHIVRSTGDRRMRAFAARATSHLSPQSWLHRETHVASAQRIRLTAVQREVLALICQGKSNPEIARLRKRSLHTVRNLVARLFELFEVQSREQLAVECVRRGLYAPV
ncbi:MAG TPA: LuxR C-terminal-related transcriptional regulator [Candidatus Elarobacter sp.]|nr:LuxR C-terminal-related transcriptional regulator [Candidatus Elarobacter sp.]